MINLTEHIQSIQNHPYILLVIGIAVRYLIGRRRFYRRGAGGLQHFSSYWLAVITTLTEWVLAVTANCIILYSLLLLFVKLK